MTLRLTIEELASEIIRAAAIVQKSHEQHYYKHTFIDSHVRFGAHKAEIERRQQRRRSLPCFFFDIRQQCCFGSGPANCAILANTADADIETVAVANDYTLRDSARFVIGVEPTTQQFVRVLKVCLCH